MLIFTILLQTPTPIGQVPTNQLTGAILIAILAAIIKFYFDGWAQRKANRLKRIDRQLEIFYGPLLALSHASEEAWNAFRSIHRAQGGPYWKSLEDQPTDYEAQVWRIWIEKVFMPLNDKIEQLIVDHADLLEEDSVPDVLLNLCAHVEAYRGVIEQWKINDLSRHLSAIDFPTGIKEYAERHYTNLKKQQAELVRNGA